MPRHNPNPHPNSDPHANHNPHLAEPIDFFDPHFHVWDVRDEGVWDGEILFKPDGKEVFDIHGYESMMRSNTPGKE